MSSTSATNDGDWSWRAERFTLTVSDAASARCCCHRRDDQAGLFGQGDEFARPDQAAARMAPAHQRFELAHPTIFELDQRLIEDFELLVAWLERPAQVGFELQTVDGARGHARIEQRPARLAAILGGVQGQVGVPEQLVHVGAVLRGGHPDGDRGEHGS
jgi:hypothetical protein